ncbi:hypothetical protein, partial [Acinetobacter baumannii]
DMSSMKGMDHDMSSKTMSSSGSDEVVYGWANASTPAGLKALQYSDLQSLT